MVSSPTAKFSEMRANGAFDATIDWNSAFLPDPTLMLVKHMSADQNAQNYAGYIDRQVDEWFEAQRQMTDVEERKETVRKIDRRILEEAWTLPVTFMARTIALSAKVKGYQLAPTHVLNTDWRGVWIDE